MIAKCTWTEEEKACIVEIMTHTLTCYEVRVKLYALEDKDIDFDRIITEGIRQELQIQQYNSNRDKVELAPYNKALKTMNSHSTNIAAENLLK